ncbi:MAG: 50S ribosomal protein L1 [Candidatus Zixiibacteriota bacterium]|nr:MAG: 50S ribosomal protein L1 [candidate division Zixibacteria bacterium]
MKHGKAYRAALDKIDRTENYEPGAAVQLIKDGVAAKFDQSVELAVNLGVDPRHADQMVRGTVSLPHGTGKAVRVLVFAKGEEVLEAQEAGADYVGAEDLIEKIKGGWLEFDVVVATPALMREVGKLGSILGPRKLMPSPKAGTVTNEIGKTVSELKAGKIEFRVDKFGIIHAVIGKVSFSVEQLTDNLNALMEAINRARPVAAKGTYLKKLTLSTTMGPGIKLDKSYYS